MKILHALCLATVFMASQSYAKTIIYVNTTADENGENNLKCSLREAVHAVNTQQAFGGCKAGERYGTNIVSLLDDATYSLTHGEIIVSHDLTIEGFYTAKEDLEDSITGVKPKRMPASTIIDGNFKRIFNTYADKSALTLNYLVIAHGKADLGGAVLAGGPVSTQNTIFTDNEATVSGGAIYLSGRDSTFTAIDSTLEKNKADKGAVLGMSCTDYLNLLYRSISITTSSIINNGSSENSSIIQGCGKISLTLETSTVAQNTAKNGILYLVDNMDSGSSLTINSSTIVENKIAPALAYDQLGALSLSSSIIAFNDLGCSKPTGNKTLYNGGGDVVGRYNTLQKCQLNYGASATADKTRKTDIDLDDASNAGANFANELYPLANYGGYTATYLPKITSKYILDKASTCKRVDQRGSDTSTNFVIHDCDVGSVERRYASAIFDTVQISSNKDDSDRVTEADPLANDIPSETEISRGDFKNPTTGLYSLKLTSTANNQCSVLTRENQRPLIRFDNKGVPLDDAHIVSCSYTFTDSNGNVSNEGQLRFKTLNKEPIASNDTYTLPSNVSSISLDLLSNDNDKNDGIYGGLCTDADNVKCNGFYIRVISQPVVGVIEAERTGNCPDYTDANKFKCYGGKITYRTKNILSPFNDKFTYVVYDIDKTFSNEATVTIINQTGVNEESSSGSLGLFSLLGLAGLAFYRRFRKSYIG